MKKNLLIIFLFITHYTVFSQTTYEDYFVYKNGDTIACNITKAQKQYIYFELAADTKFEIKRDLSKDLKARKTTNPSLKKTVYTPTKLYFYNCLDIHLSQKTKEKLKINTIEKPEDGYAYIYFYNPSQYSSKSFIIREGDTKLFKLKKDSYALLKIKAGEKHVYATVNGLGKRKVVIETENKKTYFVRALLIQCSNAPMMGMPMGGGMTFSVGTGNFGNGSCGKNLILNNDEHARLQIMTMAKKASFY